MSTNYENIKGRKNVSVNAEALIKAAHEYAAGKSCGPRGAANTVTGRESKATRHARKK